MHAAKHEIEIACLPNRSTSPPCTQQILSTKALERVHCCGQSAALRHQQQVNVRRHDHIPEKQKIALHMLPMEMLKYTVTFCG